MAKNKYINIGGLHVLADGTHVKRGQTFVSDDPDIRKSFPNKFQLVNDESPPVNAVQAAAERGAAGITPEGNENPDTGKPGSEDVTSEFTVDEDGTITVLKENGKWNVYEEGDDEPLNEKPLAKTKVQPFIDDYLAE